MNETTVCAKPEIELRRSPRIAAMQARARSASAPSAMSAVQSTWSRSQGSISKGTSLTDLSGVANDETDCYNNNLISSPDKNRNIPEMIENDTFAKPKTSRTLLRNLRKRKKGVDETLRFSSMGSKKKRKMEEGDLDNISVNSLNLNKRGRKSSKKKEDIIDGDGDNISIQSYTAGTSTRRSRTLVKVTSLASLVSPVSSVKKVGVALQRSMSFRTSHSPPFNIKPYCKPTVTPTKRRDSVLWSDTVQSNINEGLTKGQIKRQEVIYELFRGELDMVDDLKLIMKTYRDSMRSLGMLSEQELETIFGGLEDLQPLHQDLINKMNKQRKADGTTDFIGNVLLEWLPTLTNVYTAYCTNLLAAKVLLDEKRQDKKVHDFLERCQESPFSRRLDLWNFLDVPRRRLIKYPLLIQKILEVTPNEHPDKNYLAKATKAAEGVSQEVDRRTGEMKCRHYIDHLVYLRDSQEHPLISQQKKLLCSGVLRNIKGRGMKLHVFLFEDILVVTRLVTRNEEKMYQVYENPIPLQSMQLEDLDDGEVKLGGSFRSLTGGQTVKHAFRVKSTDPNGTQSFTFFASDEHDKKQWVQMFSRAIRTASSDATEV
ncbi:rho guanine nucleotide exchange factor 3-like [Acanthaster planci]|uniref:Rho guanine nucleotide exchange factor 3-like n=1 Tax=Acanthaster planci TaxID=133434 RepID=A0A8B7ZDA5_ACAPL|nr:rho guanine nucleotide exchange factor 3-like [Acanthaster planci]